MKIRFLKFPLLLALPLSIITAAPGPLAGQTAAEIAKMVAGRSGDSLPNLTQEAKAAAQQLTDDESKALESLVLSGFAAVYGEALGSAGSSGMAAFSAEAWKGGQVAKDLAKVNRWRDFTGKLNTSLGRAAGIVDLGGKIYAGDGKEAAISGVMLLLGELPNLPGGAAMMKFAGVSPPMLTAVTITFQLWLASEQALARETVGRNLQSLYGTVENMCRDNERELGVGDPFPVTKENIEKVWRRLLTDSYFRETFKSYYTEELKKDDFPEPGWFSSAGDYLLLRGDGDDVAASQEQETVAGLHERRGEFETYIAGILSGLNRFWQAEEQGVIARKVGAALSGDLDTASRSLENGLARIAYAAEKLGTVTVYAGTCGDSVRKAVEEKDFLSLMTHRKMIYDYVKDVIAWVPSGEPLGAEKDAAFAKLKSAYADAGKGLRDIKAELQQQIQKPVVPPEKQEDSEVTAESLYQAHMVPVIRQWPKFSWGWTDDADTMKTDMKKHFTALFEAGRRDAMKKTVTAWQKECFESAIQDLTDVKTGYYTPDPQKTISAYRSLLVNTGIPLPPELSYGSALSSEERARVMKSWQEAREMYRRAAETQGAIIVQEHREMLAWLENSSAAYEDLFNKISARADEIRTGLFVAGESMAPDKQEKFEGARKQFDETKYAGLPRIEKMPSKYSRGALDIPQITRDLVSDLRYRKHMISSVRERLREEARYLSESYESGVQKYNDVMRYAANDIPAARKYYDPDFLTDGYVLHQPRGGTAVTFADVTAKKSRTPGRVASLRREAAAIEAEMLQHMENIDTDVFWMERVEKDYETFDDKRRVHYLGTVATSQRDHFYPRLKAIKEGGYALIDVPSFHDGSVMIQGAHPHLFIKSKAGAALADLRGFYASSPLSGFVKSVAPYLKEDFDTFFGVIMSAKTYPEENFFLRMDTKQFNFGPDHAFVKMDLGGMGTHGLVTVSGLAAARRILDTIQPGDSAFEEKLRQMQREVPLQVFSPERRVWIDQFDAESTPLGAAFKTLAADLNAVWAAHWKFWSENAARIVDTPKPADPQPPAPAPVDNDLREVTGFYRSFKQAYESRHDIAVLGMIDDAWASSDGTTLAEVEDHFRRMFSVFDEIRYDIANMSVGRSGDAYRASYDLSITGRILRNDIRHDERSSVIEELRKDGSGRLKIRRTLQGRFWHAP